MPPLRILVSYTGYIYIYIYIFTYLNERKEKVHNSSTVGTESRCGLRLQFRLF
jgi:hypothetical protein